MCRIIVVCVMLACAIAAPEGDRITSLPGWSGSMPSAQYSGYLNIGGAGNKSLHYWFVESEGNPATDPLIFWFNGGPGCSSLGGFFIENGAWQILKGGKLQQNPFRWNRFANTLYIESPAGAGFSVAQSAAGYVQNDTVSAEDNLKATLEFLRLYPEHAAADLFLSGESYAGIYVPNLAYQIVEYNKKAQTAINLKGILVGNGCHGTEVGGCSHRDANRIDITFLRGHGLISSAAYDTVTKACGSDWSTHACAEAARTATSETGPLDLYDIYSPCATNNGTNVRAAAADGGPAWQAPPSTVHLSVGPQGCFVSDDPMTTYLNDDAVRKAIHVASKSEIGEWRVCGPRVGGGYTLDYSPTELDETKVIYPAIVAAKVRVLIFNGDVDLCVPWNGNEEWTEQFGSTLGLVEKWRPWMVQNQVAGYVTTYQGNFSFATVKGAGHMVPQTQPETSYNMVTRFVAGQPL